MENKKLLPLSIIILAVSIVFSSIWISKSIEKVINIQVESKEIVLERALLTDLEAAEYLNISIDDFNSILEKDIKEKKGLTGYSTYRFIPYLEINNGEKRFSKKELNEWIDYNTHKRELP